MTSINKPIMTLIPERAELIMRLIFFDYSGPRVSKNTERKNDDNDQ